MELPVALVKPPLHLRGLAPLQAYDHYPYRNFMPIICLIERVHTYFKEGDAVPTKVKLLLMEKTILVLWLNAGTYLPRVQAKLDAFVVAAQNGAVTDM